MRRRRSGISRRSCASGRLAGSVTGPSSSRQRRSTSWTSASAGRVDVRAPSFGATGTITRAHADSARAVSSTGITCTSSAPSSTVPSARQRSSTGRTSGRFSRGGAPAVVSAARASRVSSSSAWMSARSVKGTASCARSRPMTVRASRARRPRTASHSMPRPQIRPDSILRLMASRERPREGPTVQSGVLPRLIGHPLAALGLLACRERLALAANAGLLVVLALFELRQQPGLLALLLEALECAFEGLVGLYDDLGHLVVPPPDLTPVDKRQLYTTCPTLQQSLEANGSISN